MATIRLVNGDYDKAKSIPDSSWILIADEQVLFEVTDWIPVPAVDPVTGVITPIDPAKLNTPEPTIWELKDKNETQTFLTKNSSVLEKLPFTINKKYSGSYAYKLVVTLQSTGAKVDASIRGTCNKNVTNGQWSLSDTTVDQAEINFGHPIYLHIETEGLNGDTLYLDVFQKAPSKKEAILSNVPVECINGEI